MNNEVIKENQKAAKSKLSDNEILVSKATLHDFFAAHALQGLLAGGRDNDGERLQLGTTKEHEWLTGTARELADLMLEKRDEANEQ